MFNDLGDSFQIQIASCKNFAPLIHCAVLHMKCVPEASEWCSDACSSRSVWEIKNVASEVFLYMLHSSVLLPAKRVITANTSQHEFCLFRSLQSAFMFLTYSVGPTNMYTEFVEFF